MALLAVLTPVLTTPVEEAGNPQSQSCHDCSFKIQRVNYGTIFLPFDSIVLAENRWMNVFKIDMLKEIAPAPLWLDCPVVMGDKQILPKTSDTDFDICETLAAKLQMVHSIREGFIQTFSAELQEADKLTSHHKSQRSKRDLPPGQFHRRADLMPHEELGANIEYPGETGKIANLTTIALVKDALVTIDDMTDTVLSLMNETYLEISRILDNPFMANVQSKRQRRGLVSSVLYHVFGVARKSDVLRMKDVVQQLERGQIETGRQLEQFQNDMLSTMALSNDRISNLASGVDSLNEQIVGLTVQFSKWEILLNRGLNEVFQVLVTEIRHINKLQDTLTKYMDGILALVNGQLSPHLIDFDILQNALNEIDMVLGSDFPGHNLVEKQAAHYYRFSHPLFERVGDSLYVTLVLPVSVIPHVFRVFQVNIFPQAVGNSTSHYTKLMVDKTYLAVAENEMHFMELSEGQVRRCEDGEIKHCTEFLPVQNYQTHPTCLMAIYKNEPRKIKELCDYHLFSGKIQSEIMEIANNQFLITNAKTILSDCRSQAPSIHKPDQIVTILKIPCMCDITVDGKWIPARISTCDMETPTFTIEYPVNLPLLQELYDIEQLSKIAGDSTYSREMLDSIQLPGYLQTDSEKFSSRDADLNMRIQDALSHMRQHGSFTPQSQSLRYYRPDSFYSNSTGLNWPLVLGMIALLGIGILVLILFLYRRRWGKWVGLFSQLALPGASASLDLNSLTLDKKQDLLLAPLTKTVVEDNHDDTTMLLWVMLGLQICMIAMCIAALLFKLCQRLQRANTFLLIQFIGLHDICEVKLSPLMMPVAHMHFRADIAISDIGLSGPWYEPYLRLHHDLTVSDKLSSLQLQIPTRVQLSYWQVYLMRKIMRGQFAVVLKVLHGSQFIYLNQVCPNSCMGNQCEVSQGWSYKLHPGRADINKEGDRPSIRRGSFKDNIKQGDFAATRAPLCDAMGTKTEVV